MTSKTPIKVKPVTSCILCGYRGQNLYSHLKDSLFGVPGFWSISSCKNCALLWLDPQPLEEDTSLLYSNYYTHEGLTNNFLTSSEVSFENFPKNKKIKYAVLVAYFKYPIMVPRVYYFVGVILGAIPSFRKKVELSIGGFLPKKGARLLDLGCGNGDYLLEMKYLGFDVEGIEIDPQSAEIARSNGIPVITGTLTKNTYKENSFDAVYLNNVIEHLANPEEIMSICHTILKKGGRLCIKTCSSKSFARSLFQESYRGLEIPRHFFIFSPESLRQLGKRVGFSVKKRLHQIKKTYLRVTEQAIFFFNT